MQSLDDLETHLRTGGIVGEKEKDFSKECIITINQLQLVFGTAITSCTILSRNLTHRKESKRLISGRLRTDRRN
jgi:hypothetical protein